MIENKVPEDVRKRLTEWIGEEFPVLDCKLSQQERCQPYADLSCFPCNYLKYTQLEFDTWADLGALKEKLVAEGLLEKFECCSFYKWQDEIVHWADGTSEPEVEITWFNWLLNPVRFALRVDEFLREGGYYGR